MRIVESSAIALGGGYPQATRPAPLPVEIPPATALVVAATPLRRPHPAAHVVAGPDAGFVMQLIATAEPVESTPFDRPIVYAPRAAATAAYRATMAQANQHRARDDIGLSRTA